MKGIAASCDGWAKVQRDKQFDVGVWAVGAVVIAIVALVMLFMLIV